VLTLEQHKAALRNEYNFDHPGIVDKGEQANSLKGLCYGCGVICIKSKSFPVTTVLIPLVVLSEVSLNLKITLYSTTKYCKNHSQDCSQ